MYPQSHRSVKSGHANRVLIRSPWGDLTRRRSVRALSTPTLPWRTTDRLRYTRIGASLVWRRVNQAATQAMRGTETVRAAPRIGHGLEAPETESQSCPNQKWQAFTSLAVFQVSADPVLYSGTYNQRGREKIVQPAAQSLLTRVPQHSTASLGRMHPSVPIVSGRQSDTPFPCQPLTSPLSLLLDTQIRCTRC